MELKEKYLPIGSVVLLKDGTKKIMITGFCSIAEDDKTNLYDYSGCVYPEGYLSSEQICLFNHNQIDKLYYLGYENEEETEFKKTLNEVIEKYKNGEIEISDEEEKAENIEKEIEELEYL